MKLRFAWNRAKAERNLRLHGISFEAAAQVFDDPNHVVSENYYVDQDGEQRYQIIGMTRGLLLLLVVFVDRGDADGEVIRIVSARKAVDYEKSIYHDQFR
ncbi:MAG: BrnT family toxin [Bryobacterales bacterium]|nr:BrnT family toxin [Bryobacterales bacterium]